MNEFDKYNSTYSSVHNANIWLSGEKTEYFAEYKAEQISSFYESYKRKLSLKILDIGCGLGNIEKYLTQDFSHSSIWGIDVSEKCILEAEKKKYPNCEFKVYDGRSIPFSDNKFDLILLACVLHHVPSLLRNNLIKEIKRVLNPKGIIFIFEHNLLNPLTRYTVKSCEFDAQAEFLSRSEVIKLLNQEGISILKKKYIVFFPRFLKGLRKYEKKISFLPFGAQYLIIAGKC